MGDTKQRRRSRPAPGPAALAALFMITAGLPAAAGPVPAAVDLSGSGWVKDAVGFGVDGALMEVTVWSGAGIAAGPATVPAGAGGAYAWSFTQVPDTSLTNLTLRAWLPWDPNVTDTVVLDLANISGPTVFAGVNITLPFEAVESVALLAPAAEVVIPRGRNVTAVVQVAVDGNTSVAHSGPAVSTSTAEVTAAYVGAPGPESRPPGGSFSFVVTFAASGAAAPGNATATVVLPASSGSNLSVTIPLRVVLNRQVAVLSVSTLPAPPLEGGSGQIVVEAANHGADFASAATVRVSAHNATDPNLYSNNTAVDLPPGGARVNVSFAWVAPWSPTPITLFASAFVADDWDTSDDALNATVSVVSTNLPPSVIIGAPSDGARVAGNVTVTGGASDPEGSAVSLEFSVDGQPPFRFDSGPVFGFVWNLSLLADGPHTLNITGVDDRGNRFTASTTVVVLNRGPNSPPQVQVTAPAEGDTVGASVWVNGTASDERGELTAVFVSVDGGPEAAATGLENWSFQWNASAAGPGPHVVRVVAFDGIDRSPAATVNVTANLSAPQTLQFGAVTVAPAIVQPNGAMQVSGTLRYDTGVLAVGAEVSGNLRGFAAVGAAATDTRGQFTFSLPAPATEGDFVLDLNARAGVLLGNTTVAVRVARGSAPDLEMTPGSFHVDPDPPLANRTVRHTVDIRNLGPVPANATLRVWDVSGGAPVLIYEWEFSVTAQRQASFDRAYSAGIHNLTLRIEDVSPPDVDLSNNELAVSFRVHSLPDFEVVSITPSRTNPVAGQNISFLVVVRNVGEAGGTATFELWDGAPAAANSTRVYHEVIAMLPGEVGRFVPAWTAGAGDHEIHAVVVQSEPNELNLTNNGRSVMVHASEPDEPPPPAFLPGVGALAAAAALALGGGRLRRGDRPAPRRPRGDRPNRRGQALAAALLAAALLAALLPGPAGGRLQDADAVPGPLNGVCLTCHVDPNGGPDLNAFGLDFGEQSNTSGGPVNMTRLGALDSDGDGFTNADEWSAGYLPGDAGSNPATGVKYTGFTGGGITSAAVAGITLVALSILGTWLGFVMVQKRNQRLAARQGKPSGKDGQDPPG